MAARRGKSQARRNGSNGLPGWAWLVIGVLVTLAVVLAVPRILKSEGGADGFFRPKPNPDAQPAATNEDGEAIAPDTATDSAKPEADKPKQTQYDFYTLLPGEGVQMSDAELAASAKAEAEAQAKAAQQPDPATTATAISRCTRSISALAPAGTSRRTGSECRRHSSTRLSFDHATTLPETSGCSARVVPRRSGLVAALTHGCTSPAAYAPPSVGRRRT